jgi:midasin (ATPase involved in ribosome maturation)
MLNPADTNSLLSHILFASSVNLNNQSFDINFDEVVTDVNNNSTKINNVYHDSNCEQVLVCKNTLLCLKTRINELLAMDDFSNHPMLVELMKLIAKLESFNLNDPLMKYLTGIEILLGKSEGWKQIAPKAFCMEEELKGLSNLVIEWRKMELKYWLDSIDTELVKSKKKTSFLWFFNIFNVCNEFLNDADSGKNQLLQTLNQFLQTSNNGEYFVRLKCVELCYMIFKTKISKKQDKQLQKLVDILSSLINYHQTLFVKLIESELNDVRKTVKKELKDFISIYKWQDWNYLSLKQSIDKVNRTLFKTMRKFRVFLEQQVDFNKLVKTKISIVVPSKLGAVNKYLNNFHRLQPLIETENNSVADGYYFKAFKFCKKVLNIKFNKNLFNKSIANRTTRIYGMFNELEKETRNLLSATVIPPKATATAASAANKDDKQMVKVNKELAKKHKKDFKYLNQMKLKFISDLLKELTSLGLSYRKGKLKYEVNITY